MLNTNQVVKIAVIGRTEILYNSILVLLDAGHEIACIITAKEAPEYKKTAEDFELLAKSLEIPFQRNPNISKTGDFLNSINAEIAISLNYPNIINQEIIDMFPLGILNAHGGDLPRYKGNACQAWAILNGESSIGLCIHRMLGNELDSGDIISRSYLQINDTTKITFVWDWMVKNIPYLYLEAIEKLKDNPNYILDNNYINDSSAFRCYPRRPEDGCIDWTDNSINITRLINASNKPYDGAYCEYEGKKCIIWDAHNLEDYPRFYAVPGQILSIEKSFIDVACGSGVIRIYLLEIESVVAAPSKWVNSIRKRFK